MRRKANFYRLIIIACISGLIYAFSIKDSNWPQFRGSENNMIALGANYPTEWNDSLNVKWTCGLTGEGWSSPIVFGDRIFITSAIPEKTAPAEAQSAPTPKPDDTSFTKEIYRWELTCFDLKSGKELWKQVARSGHPSIKKHAQSTYACETPVTDGKRVYAYFGMTGIFCYDLNGKLIWQKDLGSYKTMNDWGTGSSPVVYQDLLYIQVDNEENSFIIALDAKTGTEKWKISRDEKTSYSTPVIWKNKIRTELVTIGKYARAYDPATGSLIWELKMGDGSAIPSPVYDKEHIYLGKSGGPNKPGMLFSVKAGSSGDITPADSGLVSTGVAWTLRETGVSNPSPLILNGLIYLLSGRGGEIYCLDASTGALVYKEKIANVGACWSSPWIFNNQIYFYDEKGNTKVFQAGKEFKVISQNNRLDDKFWASVAITNDDYIFRGVKKLYCVSK